MIYLRLAGGLGNQLFQLACALKCRALPNEPIFLATNALGAYKAVRRPDIQLVLDLPSIHVTTARLEPSIASIALALRFPRLLPFVGVNDRNFDPFRSYPQDGSKRFPTLADGYFQTQWDWQSLSGVLGVMASSMAALPSTQPAPGHCAIHVRGTDFLHSSPHSLIGADYYERGMTAIRACQEVTHASVITDDPDYARSVLKSTLVANSDLVFHFPEKPALMLDDFLALRDAGARIIPNSTFSWWAAALDQQGKATISPDRFVRLAKRQPVLPWERAIPAA